MITAHEQFMTYGAFSSGTYATSPARARPRPPRFASFAVALTLAAGVGGVVLVEHGVPPSASIPAPSAESAKPLVLPHLSAAVRSATGAARDKQSGRDTAGAARYASLFDQSLTAGRGPGAFADSVPIAAALATLPTHVASATQVASATPAVPPGTDLPPSSSSEPATDHDDVPLPQRRPSSLLRADLAPRAPMPMPTTQAARPAPGPAAPAQVPGFFERMFGRPQGSAAPALAYAAPEDGVLGVLGSLAGQNAGIDRFTAVYNIATHTVTLPDGTRLEAHSGLGVHLDDPNSVTEHMRGATPPAIYELQPREALFHGVRALRLNPIAGTTFGREGLLAHTFMLGPRGDSNGCVVFRDYAAFLAAYDRGAIRRLAVVAGNVHRL